MSQERSLKSEQIAYESLTGLQSVHAVGQLALPVIDEQRKSKLDYIQGSSHTLGE